MTCGYTTDDKMASEESYPWPCITIGFSPRHNCYSQNNVFSCQMQYRSIGSGVPGGGGRGGGDGPRAQALEGAPASLYRGEF